MVSNAWTGKVFTRILQKYRRIFSKVLLYRLAQGSFDDPTFKITLFTQLHCWVTLSPWNKSDVGTVKRVGSEKWIVHGELNLVHAPYKHIFDVLLPNICYNKAKM